MWTILNGETERLIENSLISGAKFQAHDESLHPEVNEFVLARLIFPPDFGKAAGMNSSLSPDMMKTCAFFI
jgi:hypothetical protein